MFFSYWTQPSMGPLTWYLDKESGRQIFYNLKLCQELSHLEFTHARVMMGPGQNFWPGLGHFFVARVGLGQPPLIKGQFPLKIPNFQFFSLWLKKNHVGLSQKYARVGSGQGQYKSFSKSVRF